MAELADTVGNQTTIGVRERRSHRLRRAPAADRIFNSTTAFLAFSVVAILTALISVLLVEAWPAIRQFGFHFLISTDWDPANDQYGALPFIYGTIVSSSLALLLAVPLSLGVGLCLSEMTPDWLSRQLGFLVELLAAIPSVVYGLWAIFVLGPWLRDHVEPFLSTYLGFLPFFKGPRIAIGMLNAGVVLAIMVLPYIAAVMTDVFRTVPRTNREAALALGATKWEMVRMAVLPFGTSGLIGAVILGLGRALGETIAVAMVIGNRPEISASLFMPSTTLASVIANEFVEATSTLNVAALIELGLVLLVLAFLMNVMARGLVAGATRRFKEAK
ncbi:MAG TPA: phosphate ABC transporter permease subunit PstC [Candidatus Binataceae bacterium]|nr:phosphate ABC transporter permease subunit PstC [Candidatus Binataceae bacterium]